MKYRLPRLLESNSIQITIAVSYSLLVLFTVVVLGTTALVLTRDALWDTTTYFTEQLTGQVESGIANYLEEMDEIATVLLSDPSVEGYLAAPDLHRQRAQDLLGTIARTRADISLLALTSPATGTLLHNPRMVVNATIDPLSQSWYREAVVENGEAVYGGARVQNLVTDRYRWVVSLSRARGDAVLLVDLNFRVIEQLAQSVQLGSRGYLFIADQDGGIVYHPQQQLIYSNLVSEPLDRILNAEPSPMVLTAGGEDRVYVVDTVERTGWKVVAVNPVDQVLAGQRRLRSYYLSWVALCFAVVMVLTVVLSRRISLPVMRLRRSMQAVEQGRFDVELTEERRDEIGALSRDFSIMVATVRDLMARNEREQEEKRQTEIKALQNQIAPHFLYNTLDSIVWMAEGGQMNEVIDMTTHLARLLRLSIGSGEAMVSLRTEIEHLRSYLTIQEMRYRDRLRFTIETPVGLNCRLPRLTVQPLVENAIYHGIKNNPDGGQVSDTGPGIAPDVLAGLQRHEVEPSGGVGVKNVHRRLQLTFGDAAGLTFSTSAETGTTVTVRVPCREDEL